MGAIHVGLVLLLALVLIALWGPGGLGPRAPRSGLTSRREGFAWGDWQENTERENFYTGFATEEPTRDYTPYTGTPNLGYWGVAPWAEAALSPAPLCG